MQLEMLYLLLAGLLALAECAMELPKFEQMKLLYPGYYLHGGHHRDQDVLDLIGGNSSSIRTHSTASLRISQVLNKFGGRHAIGANPILLSNHGRDSITGRDKQEYIFRNTAFGPFLAAKYGNPIVEVPNKNDHTKTMLPFINKQGIVRLVSYHRHHAGGHVGLWDCDHFYQSRDWTTETNLISVEFWESPDSYCPPKKDSTDPPPHLEQVDTSKLHIIVRHNYKQPVDALTKNGHRSRHARRRQGSSYRPNPKASAIWLQ